MSMLTLEQKRNEVDRLLKAVSNHDQDAALRFTWWSAFYKGRTAADVLNEPPEVDDARQVIAAESGFDSWILMRRYIDRIERNPQSDDAAFEHAVQALTHGNEHALKILLERHPQLTAARSGRSHRATLLHYVAANGVENENQVTPENIVVLTRLLFESGAVTMANATCESYGGGRGSTPLVALVTSGHPVAAGVQTELIEIFCEYGADPNGLDNDRVPLSSACAFRHRDAARTLVKYGARTDHPMLAAAMGDVDALRTMLDGWESDPSTVSPVVPSDANLPWAQLDSADAMKAQAFVLACMNNQRDAAELLLERGVDVNAGPDRGMTGLHEAALQGHAALVDWLLSNGASVTAREAQWNCTPIGWAAESGQDPIIETLLANDDVDLRDAVEREREDVARRLLDAGADPEGPDGCGAPLRIAAWRGNESIVELLLDRGADRTATGPTGVNAAWCAKHRGHSELAERLMPEDSS